MKRTVYMAAVLMAAVLFSGCSTTAQAETSAKTEVSEAANRLEAIKEKGYMEVVMEPYLAPFEFIDPSQKGDEMYVGADVELAKYIADQLGVECRIIPLDFATVLSSITEGKYDMAISAIAYSPTRAENMTLSNVYQTSDGYGFMVRAEDADKYNSIEDLKDAVVITQSGSVQESLYNENVKECKEFKLVANMTDGYLAVAENKADVCICSTESAQLYAEANGGLYIPEFRFDIDPNMNGTVVALPPQGSESLLEVVNEAIAELTEQGLIEQWNEEYTAYAAELGIE